MNQHARPRTSTARLNGIRRRALNMAISAALIGGLSMSAQAQFPPVIELGSLDGSDGFRLDGAAEGDGAGASVAGAGDINADGIDDLIVGAPYADPNGILNSGSSYVVFGRDTATAGDFLATLDLSGLNGTDGFRLDGAAVASRSGASLAPAGDINGDGIGDLIVGAHYAGPNGIRSGSSYVVFGKDTVNGLGFPATLDLSSLDGSDGFRLDGLAAEDRSGRSVAAAGDINGDGLDDLIIGAHGADPNGIANAGSSYLVFGRNTATVGDFPAALDLSSLDGSNGFRLDGAAPLDLSGFSVASAGDINGDGLDDLIVGANYADPNGEKSGSSYVVFGRDTAMAGDFPATLALSSLDGSNGFRLDGAAASNRSGFSVASAGDINGDGLGDLIIGAHGADPNGSFSGSSYVVFGRDTATVGNFPATLALSSLNGMDGFRLDGVAAGDASGFSVASAGDINGDGFDDLLVGAFLANTNGSNSGSTYVVLGKDTATAGNFAATLALSDLDGSNGFRLDGVAAEDRSGISVASAGDINGDGLDDLIVGAIAADPNGITNAGSSYVVFGRQPVLPAPIVLLMPDPLNFSDVELGMTATETLIVENIGDGTLQPGTLSITGPQAGEFNIELDDCADAQLANSEFCGIDIGFAPTAPGIRQATLSLQSNAPSSPHLVQLRGSNDVVFADEFETQ